MADKVIKRNGVVIERRDKDGKLIDLKPKELRVRALEEGNED